METYAQKLATKIGGRIAYPELLQLKEWRDKRQEIINRENNHYQVCKKKCMDDYFPKIVGHSGVYFQPATYEFIDVPIEIVHPLYGDIRYIDQQLRLVPQDEPHIPHVHHTYYVRRKLPWDYPNESLMLVCHTCHNSIHEKQIITVYMDTSFNEVQSLTVCTRCNGKGYIYEYNHVENGVCFRCNGACFDDWIAPTTYST